ncbi:glutathione peroxidase [Catenovulum adriaticum]|uniref:Glutathione peroxidase n=1 Tax=Catenovulum adriaticum TaxID=2984846 RepID=A0ABY7AL07_9ALTE|nr:glutathione peroxidase [Catenovulum sp. TS8]WAJ70248.1 glutathione peroxidase [Catenovulum sp. TS8]
MRLSVNRKASHFLLLTLSCLINLPNAVADNSQTAKPAKMNKSCPEQLNFKAEKLHSNKTIDFCEQFNGKTLLVVNTASDCGFTPQFKQLEALYEKYKDQGLEVVGFPSNDFFQERTNEKETAEICFVNYGVTFTMLSSSSVKGDDANPFFKNIIKQSGTAPKWNFYKYLLNDKGQVVQSYNSKAEPLGEVEQDIKKLLKNAS